jgi:Ser/Thr protein kinase RdoA (MazF antagonist)
MTTVRRRPSQYQTSFPLEELSVAQPDGTELRLACKRLSWSALEDEARLAKPRFLHDPGREPAVYAHVLPQAPPGPPRYHGSFTDPEGGGPRLLVEWVEGRELYQVGEREHWEAAASWLGRMHVALAADLDRHAARGRLLEYDASHYRVWLERAGEFARAPGQPRSRAVAVERIAQRYEEAIEELLALPRTVIHGEFYASNVLVAGEPRSPRIAPVDWELAAAAPGVVDLAALTSGSGWSDRDRSAIVAAYRSTIPSGAPSRRDLDLARLHLAVQWLGWAPPSWQPPADQRQDWQGEALALVEELGL